MGVAFSAFRFSRMTRIRFSKATLPRTTASKNTGMPTESHTFPPVNPTIRYPINEIIAIVTAYTASVLTCTMKLQFTQELTRIVLSQIGEMLSPNTDPQRHAEMQGTSNVRSVFVQMLTTIGTSTEKPAHVVPSENVSNAPTRNTTEGMIQNGR